MWHYKADTKIPQSSSTVITWPFFICLVGLFVFDVTAPQWSRAYSFTRFLDHTQRRTTVGRTPPDERAAHRKDLYATTHNAHNRQTSMPPLGFEPTLSVSERPQTYALDRAATGTGVIWSNRSEMNEGRFCCDFTGADTLCHVLLPAASFACSAL